MKRSGCHQGYATYQQQQGYNSFKQQRYASQGKNLLFLQIFVSRAFFTIYTQNIETSNYILGGGGIEGCCYTYAGDGHNSFCKGIT